MTAPVSLDSLTAPISLDSLTAPHSIEAEKAVLGGLLIEPSLFDVAQPVVRAEDFFRDAHVRIFMAIGKVISRHGAVDLITIANELEASGHLEEAGGRAYLAGLVDGVPHATNVEHYARIVRRLADGRRLIPDFRRVLVELYREGASGDAIASAVRAVERVQRAAPTEAADDRRFVTAASSCQEQPTVPMLLAPYVPVAAIGELVAKVKIGKTTFALELTRCIRQGVSFAGHAAPDRPQRVLYATEQPKASFAKQLRDAGLQHDEELLITYLSAWAGRPWPEVGSALVAYAVKKDIAFIAIDTAGRWFGFRDDEENHSGAAEHVNVLLPFCANGGTILLVRHGRKSGGAVGDAARGSSAIDGAVDFILQLSVAPDHAGDDVRTIESVGRFDMPRHLLVRRNIQHHQHQEIADGEEVPASYIFDKMEQTASGTSLEARICSAMADRPRTQSELAAELKVSESTIGRALNGLTSSGRVARVGKGGPRNNAYLYALIDQSGTSPSQSLRDGDDEVA